MSVTINLRGFGGRYSGVVPDSVALKGAQKQQASHHQESVLEFVTYLYAQIRDDAAMVATLDRAVKERYHADR